MKTAMPIAMGASTCTHRDKFHSQGCSFAAVLDFHIVELLRNDCDMMRLQCR